MLTTETTRDERAAQLDAVETVEELHRLLGYAEAMVESGDWISPDAMRWGREYHRVADAIKRRTGRDPRPRA